MIRYRHPVQLVLVAVLCVASFACAALKADVKTLTPEAEAAAAKAVACIVGQVAIGNTSAASLALVCGLPAAADALAITTQIVTSLSGPAPAASIGAPYDTGALVSKLKAVH